MRMKKTALLILAVLLTAAIPFSGAVAFADSGAAQEPVLTVEGRETIPERALVGTEITLPGAVAEDPVDGVLPYTVRVSVGDQVITQADSDTYVLSETGVYTLYYEAVNSRGFYAFDSIQIDVRKLWLSIETRGERPASALVGQRVAIPTAVCKNFAGEELAGVPVTVSVTRGGSAVAVSENAFEASEAGVYTVTYSAEKDGETADAVTFTVTVTGSRPVLIVKNLPAEGVPGSVVLLPRASARDDNGKAVTVEVAVTLDGAAVAVTQQEDGYAFTPEKEGAYVVTYTATNSEGVQEAAAFTVLVVQPAGGCGCGAIGAGTSGGIGALLALTALGLGAMCLFLRKRRQA